MTKKKSPIRIKGLVSFMNHVREQLSAGIPPDQVAQFRTVVRENLRAVETICRQHHITPNDLPAPSRRAYAYLKGLNLKNLPVRSEPVPNTPKEVRVTNIVSVSDYFQVELLRLARQNATWNGSDPQVKGLAQEMLGHVTAIADLCEEQGGSPVDLPVRSRRGYQWLAFLADPENLALHLTTLAKAQQIAKQKACCQGLAKAARDLPLHLEFYNTSSLFRTRVRRHDVQLVINEGFIGASSAVLKAVLCAAIGSKKHVTDAKAYAVSEEFSEITLALDLTTADLSPDTRGRVYDLAEVFERVNATYFGGALPCPRLTWNRTPTYRKMGHYNFMTDTVMLSLTLDDTRVPAHVVDYVMYHELLHKQLGVTMVNGRRYAHTPEFRAAEQAFPHYEAATAFLNKVGKGA